VAHRARGQRARRQAARRTRASVRVERRLTGARRPRGGPRLGPGPPRASVGYRGRFRFGRRRFARRGARRRQRVWSQHVIRAGRGARYVDDRGALTRSRGWRVKPRSRRRRRHVAHAVAAGQPRRAGRAADRRRGPARGLRRRRVDRQRRRRLFAARLRPAAPRASRPSRAPGVGPPIDRGLRQLDAARPRRSLHL